MTPVPEFTEELSELYSRRKVGPPLFLRCLQWRCGFAINEGPWDVLILSSKSPLHTEQILVSKPIYEVAGLWRGASL